MYQDRARRNRRHRSVRRDQGIGGGRHLAKIFLLHSQPQNTFANVAFLCQRHPELLPVFDGSFSPDKIVYNLAFTDPAEPNRFILDQLLDFALRGQWHINKLGNGEMLRQHEGQWRGAPRVERRQQVGLDFLRGNETLGVQVNQFFLLDPDAAEIAFRQEQFQAATSGIQSRHTPDRRAQARERGERANHE